jgi:hypothetical protein
LTKLPPPFVAEVQAIQAELQQADGLPDAAQVTSAYDAAKAQFQDVLVRAKQARDAAEAQLQAALAQVAQLQAILARGLNLKPPFVAEVQAIQAELQQAQGLTDAAQVTTAFDDARAQYQDVLARAKQARDAEEAAAEALRQQLQAALAQVTQLQANIAKGLNMVKPPFLKEVQDIQTSLQGAAALTDPAQITAVCDAAKAQYADVLARATQKAQEALEVEDLRNQVQDLLNKLNVFFAAAPGFVNQTYSLIGNAESLLQVLAAPDPNLDSVKAEYAALRLRLISLLKQNAGKNNAPKQTAVSGSGTAATVQQPKTPVQKPKKLPMTKAALTPEAFKFYDWEGKPVTLYDALKIPDIYLVELAEATGEDPDKVEALLNEALAELVTQTEALIPKNFKRPYGDSNTINVLLPGESRPNLTLEEAKAVHFYTTEDGFKAMNPLLWKNQPLPPGPLADAHQALQDAFAKAQPFKERKVNRGMNFKDPVELASYLKPFQDAVNTDTLVPLTGYISTGSAGTPPDFNGNIEFVILAKKGLDVLPYSEYPAEKELLLDHNTLVKAHSCTDNGGKWTVVVEQMLQLVN